MAANVALVAAEKKILVFCAQDCAQATGIFEEDVGSVQTEVNDAPADRRDDHRLDGRFAGIEEQAVGPSGVIMQLHAGRQPGAVLGAGGRQAECQGQKDRGENGGWRMEDKP